MTELVNSFTYLLKRSIYHGYEGWYTQYFFALKMSDFSELQIYGPPRWIRLKCLKFLLEIRQNTCDGQEETEGETSPLD